MRVLRDLLSEVHERSLWQVAGSYAIGAWAILQIAETLSSLIGLPLWFGQAVLLLLLPGLPIVLITAVMQASRRPESNAALPWQRRIFSWRTAMVAGLVAFSTLGLGTGVYLGARSAGIGSIGTLLARGDFQEADRVILADLQATGGDSVLSVTATQLLRVDLQQSPSLTLIEPASVSQALTRMRRSPSSRITEALAREIAIRDGIEAVIAGEVTQIDGTYLLTARLVVPSDGRELVSVRASSPQFPRAVDRLSAQLRERIGESLRSLQGEPPLAQVTTESLSALQLYAFADRAYGQGEVERALALLDESLLEDSLFAMGYRKKGVILSNVGRSDYEPAITRAYELRDRLTDRERLITIGSFHYWVEEDLQAASLAYENLLDRYPTDVTGLNNLAVIYQSEGRVDDAIDLYRRAVASGAGIPVVYTNLVWQLTERGEHAEAERVVAAGIERFGPIPSLIGWEAMLGVERRDYTRVDEVMNAMAATSSDEQYGWLAGPYDILRGRLEAGLGRLDATPGWPYGSAATRGLAESFVLDDSQVLLDAAREETFNAVESYAAAHALAWAGEVSAARRLVESQNGPEMSAQVEWYSLRATGAIAMAEGRVEDAMTAISEADGLAAEDFRCGVTMDLDRAKAYDRIGDFDTAIALYEAFLEPDLNRLPCTSGFHDGPTMERLAQLFEERSDSANAIKYHEMLIDLWEDADLVLQPRVEDARDAVAGLRG